MKPTQEYNLVHNLSYGNEFDLQDNERAGKTHFRMKGCAPNLVPRSPSATFQCQTEWDLGTRLLCTRTRFETEVKGNSEMIF